MTAWGVRIVLVGSKSPESIPGGRGEDVFFGGGFLGGCQKGGVLGGEGGGIGGGIGVHKSALFCFFDPRVHPTGVRNGTNLSNY